MLLANSSIGTSRMPSHDSPPCDYLTANLNDEREWSDRKLPGGLKAAWGDRHAVWENEVMLANETGKDLYITIPVNASADYVSKLGQPHALRFGRREPLRGRCLRSCLPWIEPQSSPLRGMGQRSLELGLQSGAGW